MEDKELSCEMNNYIESLINGDRRECIKYVKDYLGTADHISLYEEVLKKSLYHVGEMWELNRITVATEHLATSVTESVLNYLYEDIISSERNGRKVVAACTENEEHQVGVKMVADVFEKAGWETFFLGANVPSGELVIFIRKIQPDLLALSLSLYFNLPALHKMLGMVRSEFPELPVIVGGQAFRHGGKESLAAYKNILFIPDLYELKQFLKNKNGAQL